MKEENRYLGISTLLGQEFLVQCHVIASLFDKKKNLAWEKGFYFFPFLMCILEPGTHLFTGYYMRREMENQFRSQKIGNQWPSFSNESPSDK